MVLNGLTVANVLGVPLGTLVGQSAGWRGTFVLIVVLGVIALAGLIRTLKGMPSPGVASRGQRITVARICGILFTFLSANGTGKFPR